jgi:hypothetical protein
VSIIHFIEFAIKDAPADDKKAIKTSTSSQVGSIMLVFSSIISYLAFAIKRAGLTSTTSQGGSKYARFLSIITFLSNSHLLVNSHLHVPSFVRYTTQGGYVVVKTDDVL